MVRPPAVAAAGPPLAEANRAGHCTKKWRSRGGAGCLSSGSAGRHCANAEARGGTVPATSVPPAGRHPTRTDPGRSASGLPGQVVLPAWASVLTGTTRNKTETHLCILRGDPRGTQEVGDRWSADRPRRVAHRRFSPSAIPASATWRDRDRRETRDRPREPGFRIPSLANRNRSRGGTGRPGNTP